ncbi:hypothetical protein HaLaN_07544, partial [Haematococcus lacustris]
MKSCSPDHLGRALQRCSAASYSNSTPSTSTALHRVFVFDASNPDSTVQELLVEPHADIEAAEEMLQQEAINLQQHGRDHGGGLAGRDPSVAMAKTSEMQKQLVAQLEREQGQ